MCMACAGHPDGKRMVHHHCRRHHPHAHVPDGLFCSEGTKGAQGKSLPILDPNTICKPNPDPNAHPSPKPSSSPNPTPTPMQIGCFLRLILRYFRPEKRSLGSQICCKTR